MEILTHLKKDFADVKLYVPSRKLIQTGFKAKLSYSYYDRYILKLIKKNHLEKNVVFLNQLNEDEMKTRFLSSHVFLSASTIENSSNSICEAMILGVPCVASRVGGTESLLNHGKEGFLYQADATYLAYYYIKQIFENDKLAEELSVNSIKRAESVHDRKSIIENMLTIYSDILRKDQQ